MKEFIEHFSNDNSLSTKQKIINIMNLYHIWLSIISEDVKFIHKENLFKMEKEKMNNSAKICDISFDDFFKKFAI
jgi:hypothetical protein